MPSQKNSGNGMTNKGIMTHILTEVTELGKKVGMQNEAISEIKKDTAAIFSKIDNFTEEIGTVKTRVSILEDRNHTREKTAEQAFGSQELAMKERHFKQNAKRYELYLVILAFGALFTVISLFFPKHNSPAQPIRRESSRSDSTQALLKINGPSGTSLIGE